jgi:4-amino-4-deoxy-L-arabinose transferase-like glycosyltransferase
LASAAKPVTGAPPPWLAFLLVLLAVIALLKLPPHERQEDYNPKGSDPRPPVAQPRLTAVGFTPYVGDLNIGRVILLVMAIVLTVFVLFRLPKLGRLDNHTLVAAAWFLAIVVYVLAVAWPRRPGSGEIREKLSKIWNRRRTEVVLLTGIMIVALLLRVVYLASIPFTLGGDEASQGLEALRVIEGDTLNPFTTGWFGVPTLSFYFNSLSLLLFGPTTAALRLPWALTGTVTILVTFLLVRRLQNKELAFATAALVAVYHFHIHYSRLGSNQIASALFVALALLFLYRALDDNRPLDWSMTGVVAGLALYFYAGARLTPIVVSAILLYLFIRRPIGFWRRYGRGLVIMIGGFLLAGAPMLQYAYRFPNDFNSRINQVGIIQSGWLDLQLAAGRDLLEVLYDQFRRSVLAFNYYPDRTVWYGLRKPLLDPLFGVIFLIGLGYGTLAILGKKEKQRLAPMVIWWWSGMFLGGMLTESPPSSMRLVVLSVPVCYFIALATWRVIKLADIAITRVPAKALMVLGVLIFGLVSVRTYFVDYSPQRIYGGGHAELATELAPIMNQIESTHQVFFFGAPLMVWDFSTIRYLAPDVVGSDIMEPLSGPIPDNSLESGRRATFVFLPHRIDELETIRRQFPGGEIRELHSKGVDKQLMATIYISPQ